MGLVQFHHYNSGPINIEGPGVSGQSDWTCPFPLVVVKRTYLWVGVTAGVALDAQIDIRRASDMALVDLLQWDHYKDPTAPNHRGFEHHPDGWEITQGNSLYIVFASSSASAPPGVVPQIHFVADIVGVRVS